MFSTQVDEAFGYINSFMYDGQYLIWNTDGLAGYIRITNGKFSITNIVGIMFFKEPFSADNIYLEYIKYMIEPIFRINKKGRMGEQGKNEYTKLNSTMIRQMNIIIPIPLKSDGTFDLEAQKEIAHKYQKVENMKELLKKKKEEVERFEVQEFDGYDCKEVKITDLFTPKLGDGKYTKEFCLSNKGIFPVYSGNTVQEFSNINEYAYDGEYLTWAKDGISGYIMYHNEKFAITNHRGILIPTELCQNIDLDYIKHMIEPIFRTNKKGRLGINGKNEYTTLNIDMIKNIEETIAIPVKPDGTFDLEALKEIAAKYKVVNNIKKSITTQIDKLLLCDINF